MSNSPLVNYTRISPNKTSPRNQKIDRITIHHMAGNATVETCGNIFAPTSRKASSNYGIDSKGRVGMYVEEKDRSWCSSSSANDNRAVTIEVADDMNKAPWHSSDAAMKKLVELCADICKRNGIKKLVYTGDTKGNLTMHKWFANTDCPGAYLESKFPWIAEQVNKLLNGASGSTPSPAPSPTPATKTMYRVRKTWTDAKSQIGAFADLNNAKKCADANKGYTVFNESGVAVYPVANTSNPVQKPSVNKIEEDGKWGTATTKRAQQVFGTTVDGVISNQLSDYKPICQGLRSGVEWNETKRGGSSLVKAMQKWLGINVDGYIGTQFIKALQKKMGTSVDGILSNPSKCIKAFQHWLNQQ